MICSEKENAIYECVVCETTWKKSHKHYTDGKKLDKKK